MRVRSSTSLVLLVGARETKGQKPNVRSVPHRSAAELKSGGDSHGERPPSRMNPSDAQSTALTHGEMLTAISDGLVALLKEFYGRGPTRAKSYYEDDLVVCLLRGGFTRVEQTLLEGGRGASVIQQRMEFQELMRERFEAVIEAATGRRVIGFMSGNQQHPDIMCEVFILAPTDLVDDHEHPTAGRPPPP
jgi:uncharacterized protein YbcI